MFAISNFLFKLKAYVYNVHILLIYICMYILYIQYKYSRFTSFGSFILDFSVTIVFNIPKYKGTYVYVYAYICKRL